MTATLREVQAHLLHALGGAGGTVPLRTVAGTVPADLLDRAVEDLAAAGLVEHPADGVLRRGRRGSALAAADVARRLRTRTFGHPVEVRAVTASTNDVVLERAASGARPGLCVAAELQTAGRGRRGRSFDSRPGLGLWSTTLLPAPGDPSRAPRLALVVALAVADAIETVTGTAPALKWPNDVLIDGRKTGGILVEARSAGGAVVPVAGIGLNVHHRDEDFPPELAGRAGSLEACTGARVERSALLAELLARLEAALDEEAGGGLDLAARFGRRDALRDREVVVDGPAGSTTGRARGIDARGRLLLDTGGAGTVAVQAGEATVRSGAAC